MSHVLADATARCHPYDDAICSSQREGEQIDARISSLSALTEATPEARAEIWTVAQDLARAVGRESGGGAPPLWTWFRKGIGAIRREAERLFPAEPWVADVRGPAWR